MDSTALWTLLLLPLLLWAGKKLADALFQDSLAALKRRFLDRRASHESRAQIEAYTRLLAAPAVEQFFGIHRSTTFIRRDVKRQGAEGGALALEDAVAREAKLVLLGEPGMGKSTAVRELESRAALSRTVPLYVELKRFTSTEGLDALIVARIRQVLASRRDAAPEDARRLLHQCLASEDLHVLLLFDGLNEVAPEHHGAVRDELQTWLGSRHRVVVSSRESDYDESLKAPAFVLQPLHPYQISRLLGHELYEGQVRFRPHLSELAGNPFLLSLMQTLVAADPKKELPENLGKLFERTLPLLPRLRSGEGLPTRVPPDVVFAALAKAAFEMQRAGRLTAVYTDVYTWALPTAGKPLDEVLAQAREWRILKADGLSGEPLEFLHQLIQEYFAATYLDQQLRRGEYPGDYVFDARWHEVVTMLAGVCATPAELVQWLSARLIASGRANAAGLVKRSWETSSAAASADARAAVIAALKFAVKDGDPEVRELAAFWLGGMGGAETLDSLLEALHDPDWRVRERAGYELCKLGDPRAVPTLINALSDPEANVRQRASEALAKIGNPRGVEPLIAALDDPESRVRESAAKALGDVGDPRAVAPLAARLTGPNTYVRFALRDIGGPAVDALTDALRSPDTHVRKAAADVLGDIRDARAIEPLRQLLDDPVETVRSAAVYALARIGTEEALEPLCAALRDSSDDVRRLAVSGMQGLRDARAVEPLIAALRDSSQAVRRIAAAALGELGDRRAIEALLNALHDPDSAVVSAAAGSLATFGGAELVDPLIAALRRSRTAVMDALVRIGTPAVEPVIRLLRDRDIGMRMLAALILSGIGDRRALPALRWTALRRRGFDAEAARAAVDNIRKRAR